MSSTLNLNSANEIIRIRTALHGGRVGAPQLTQDGEREGAALNRAGVVLLTSSLQVFVEDVFLAASAKAFGEFKDNTVKSKYEKTYSRWGNPSAENIISLFRRLAINGVFDGLSWGGQSSDRLKNNLNYLNWIRNGIAHGGEIRIRGEVYNLTTSKLSRFVRVSTTFGQRFEGHVLGKFN